MWYKKSIPRLVAEAEQSGEGTLKRPLTSSGLIALGVGAIIGAGLFSLTGIIPKFYKKINLLFSRFIFYLFLLF